MLVEKMAGCNHMTCKACRYEWCWLCGATYTSYHFSNWNPLGCPGLQGGHHRDNYKRILCKRFCMIIGYLLLLPFAIVIGLVLGFPIFFTTKCADDCECMYRYDQNCCCKLLKIILVFVIGLLLNVLVAPLAVVCLPFLLIYLLVCYCKERLDRRRRY
jgi:hypothetical protein